MAYTALKFKLYPSQEQLSVLQQNAGCTRFLYNHFLDFRIKEYEKFKKGKISNTSSGYDLQKRIPELKSKFEWLKVADSTSLQQACLDLETAYKNFFRRVKQGQNPGFPKFKKKGNKDSFKLKMSIELDADSKSVKLGKHGWFPCRGSFDYVPNNYKKIVNITVSEDAGNWYASILFEIKDPKKIKHENKDSSVGIDLGVRKPITAFNGIGFSSFKSIQFSKDLKDKEEKREKYQKRLARCKLGSKNRLKAKAKVTKAYKAERDFRTNFIEQTSHKLCSKYETIVFENLTIRNMTKKGSGKKKLNNSVLRLAHSQLVQTCSRKSDRYGTTIVLVDPAYTSQTCNSCGSIHKHNRKNQSEFHCLECGHTENADFNAARNILEIGLA